MVERMTKKEMQAHIRQVVETYASQRQAALALGISQAYLNDLLHGYRTPGKKVLGVFGYAQRIYYEPIGETHA